MHHGATKLRGVMISTRAQSNTFAGDRLDRTEKLTEIGLFVL
jgi:hypothetical protein